MTLVMQGRCLPPEPQIELLLNTIVCVFKFDGESMTRKYNWDNKEDLAKIVRESSTITEVLHKVGLENKGGNFNTFKKATSRHGIDYSHFSQPGSVRGEKNLNYIPLDEYLKKSHPKNQIIKQKMIREGHTKDECSRCGIGNEWNGMPLVLQLDHIDGDSSNNTISNFRILCPNCHTQTRTFGNKNRTPKRNCSVCDAPIYSGNRKTCSDVCLGVHRGKERVARNSVWDSCDLESMVKTMTNVQIAKLIGVSETAVRKRRKRMGI